MRRRVLLLRHTAVASHWAGRCYGRSEAGLGRAGIAAARLLAGAVPPFGRVVASPSRRALLAGALIARRLGLPLLTDPLLAERDFGRWEGRSWDAIWRAEGNSMDGMLDDPDRFRPGGGETTAELAARALAWWHALPDDASVVAATHGGPIAALCGTLLRGTPRDWLTHVPPQGEGALVTLVAGALTITPWRVSGLEAARDP